VYQLATQLWPSAQEEGSSTSSDPKQDIDDELAKELAELRKKPNKKEAKDKLFSEPPNARFNDHEFIAKYPDVVHTDVECRESESKSDETTIL
jgi:hypothetical protein